MDAETHIKKPHYAWLILASCIAFYSSTMGMLVNTQGIFMPPILKEFGWSATQFSIPTIISGVVSVLTLTFVDKIYKRFTLKPVLLIAVFLYQLGFMLKSLTHSYMYYCATMVLIGISGAFVLYVPLPMLLNAWFEKKKGFAMGMAFLSSGLAGAVMNPIISTVIENSGWRLAFVAVAGIAMTISLPFLIFVITEKPQDKGMFPYGANEAARKISIDNADPDHGKAAQEYFNSRFSAGEKRQKFILCITLAALLNLLSIISSHLPNFASSLGLAAAIGATVTSAQMVGNLTSKAVVGSCMDKFGKYKTILISMIIVFFGYVLLGLSSKAVILMYVAAVMLGITAAHNTMVPPAMVETFAIGDEYAKYISKVSMGTMLASAFANTITSGIYDLTGSYCIVWFVYAGIEIVCIVLLVMFYNKRPDFIRRVGHHEV